MRNYMRCKVCGFVGDEKEMKDVCPACGVPKAAFESYKFNISEKRLKVLSIHLHPILVHFPQSIAFLSLIFIIIAFAAKDPLSGNLIAVEKLLSALLPVSVLISAAAGIVDVKIRFKKKFGPRIKQKIIVGVVFLVVSAALAIMINAEAFGTGGKILIIVLSIICFGCSGLLGKLGGSLLEAKLPG